LYGKYSYLILSIFIGFGMLEIFVDLNVNLVLISFIMTYVDSLDRNFGD